MFPCASVQVKLAGQSWQSTFKKEKEKEKLSHMTKQGSRQCNILAKNIKCDNIDLQ